MKMPISIAWERLISECVDTRKDLVVITKKNIESLTGNELRLMAKMDSSAAVPEALRRHGYFPLPTKRGEYLLVRGKGFHVLEQLREPPTVFRPKLDFDFMSLSVGDGEMQHLDYCFNVGLLEKFADAKGLCQTIRGRKYVPPFQFSVGSLGPIHVKKGVQVEVDTGCEGRNDIVLVEAKCGQPSDFIIRQLFYPYQMWRRKVPQKRIRPWFFCSHEVAGRRLYKFWEYSFLDETQYDSLTLLRAEAFLIEPRRARLSVEELLRGHIEKQRKNDSWDVPQADTFRRVAEIPLLIAQGINTSAKVALHYKFDQRQSSYYRQAAEFLGLVSLDKKNKRYHLTDLGSQYTDLSADERRQLLAGILAKFPPMHATLELSANAGERGIGKNEITTLITRHSSIGKSTPARRAATLLSWLKWLQEATGAIQENKKRFSLS